MSGKQDGAAETLDLQSSRGLRLEAVPEATGREHRERRDHDHDDARENEQRLQRTAAARAHPDVGGGGRDEHERIDLRRHGQPEQAEGEKVATAQERGQRADRQRGGEEVVRVERDGPDGEGRERKEPGRCVKGPPADAELHEHEHDGE